MPGHDQPYRRERHGDRERPRPRASGFCRAPSDSGISATADTTSGRQDGRGRRGRQPGGAPPGPPPASHGWRRLPSRTQRYARTVPGTLPLSAETPRLGHRFTKQGLRRPAPCHATTPGSPRQEDHQLAKQVAGLDAGQVIRWKSWHRWTAICLLAYIYLAVTVALQRQQDASSDLDAGLIPVTVPELLRLLRVTVIPPPRRDRPTGCTGPPGDAATSTAPAKPTNAGTPTPRQHHDHNELQLPYQGPNGEPFTSRFASAGPLEARRTALSVALVDVNQGPAGGLRSGRARGL